MAGFGLSLAVVPIVANVTAALAPAAMAGLATVLGALRDPRALIAAARRRPRRLLGIVGVLALTGIGIGVATRPVEATAIDWLAVAESLERDPRDQAPPPTTADPAAPLVDLEVAWRFTIPGALFLGAPVVIGERVVAGYCLPEGSESYGGFVCVELATGLEVWTRDTLPDGADIRGVFSSPAFDPARRLIVVGQGLHFDSGCGLVGLDADTGVPRFVVAAPIHIESSPALAPHLAVVGVGAIEVGLDKVVRGDPGYLLAVDLDRGVELWRHPLIDPESSPAIAGDLAVIGCGFGGQAVVALRLGALAPGESREAWRVATAHAITAPITISSGIAYATGGNADFVSGIDPPHGEVLAIDLATGATRWHRQDVGSAVLTGALVRGDRVLVGTRRGDLLCLAAADGAPVWERRLTATSMLLAPLVEAQGVIYAPLADGTLTLVGLESGEVIQRTGLLVPGRPAERQLGTSRVVIAGDRLVVGTENGGLVCLSGARRVPR